MCTTYLEQTLTLIKRRPRECTYAKLSEATGIPLRTILSIVHGEVTNPGVNTIDTLNRYLVEQNAKV